MAVRLSSVILKTLAFMGKPDLSWLTILGKGLFMSVKGNNY